MQSLYHTVTKYIRIYIKIFILSDCTEYKYNPIQVLVYKIATYIPQNPGMGKNEHAEKITKGVIIAFYSSFDIYVLIKKV